MMEFWISHPATQDRPVGFRRWLAYHVGMKLDLWARKLEWYGIHGRGFYDDDIPF